MKHYLFSGKETADEIRQILVDNCEGVEDMEVQKRLTEEELTELAKDFADNNVELGKHTEALYAAKTVYKEAIKPIQSENKDIIASFKSKYKTVNEKVYRMANHESGMMEFVNLEGEVVSTRKLKPEERQGRLTPMHRAVNQ